ncbi:hypothetical protein [Pseudorhodoferax sp.]|uniref:hypothetical protein n=1 Tax=Pseudorhodoferax sp. TaxID=1993553 RepID=UPI002DD64B34|nr:hypothetical protein [Pseudorhodoferax sp.]
MILRSIAILLLALLSSSVIAEDIQFTKIKLVNLFNASATAADHEALPIVLNFPSTFSVETRDVGGGRAMVFIKSSSTDVNSFFDRAVPTVVGEGFFTITLSMNVGFIPGANKFTDEDKGNADLEKLGYKDFVSNRMDKNGVPILEKTSTAPDGRRGFVAYIAIGQSRSAIRVIYYHPPIFRPLDSIIWRTFVDNLGG